MADLFAKFAPFAERRAQLGALGGPNPFDLCLERVLSPTEAIIEGRRTLLVGSNNYLGLSLDAACVEAAVAATRAEGVGTTGSRVANGTYAGHRLLERRLAALFGRRSAVLFSTGYQANLAVLSALAGPRDTILIDVDSHACIYDGSRLSGATVLRYRHNDPDDLDRRLGRLQREPGGGVLIVAEGIYSMRGDRAPLAELVAVKRRHGALLLLDEAHSFGVFGARGRGLAEAEGLADEVDLIVGTFSKSVGTVGGFCVADRPELDLLRYAARPYVFTASLPPGVVAGALAALERIEHGDDLRARLWDNLRGLHDRLRALGFDLLAPESPILAVPMPSAERALAFWRGLIEEGVYVNLALPPATPAGTFLLRCSVCAAHTPSQLDRIAAAFARVGRRLAVIP